MKRSSSFLEFFAHHGIWALGIRMFRRLRFQAKAWIITLVFMIPTLFLSWQYFGDKADAIGFSDKERVGIEYAKVLIPLLSEQASAQAPQRPDLNALAKLQTAVGKDLGTDAAYQTLTQTSGQTADKVRTALVNLLSTSTDGSNLTLDPDIDTYYLMDTTMFRLPVMLDLQAQLRDLAAAPATAATQRQAIEAMAVLRTQVDAVAVDLDKVLAYNPEVKSQLDAQAGLQAARQFMQTVETGWLSAAPDKRQTAPIAAAALASHQSLMGLNQQATQQLDSLIAARIGRLAQARTTTIIVTLLAFAAAGYLFLSFRRVLEGGLNEIAFHVDCIRKGDLTTTLPTPWGRDEAAFLMTSMQAMQTSLRNIVAQVRLASDGIVTGSHEIAQGAQNLSGRTEDAAAHLQQSAAAVEQVSTNLAQTASNVTAAASVAGRNSQAANAGGKVFGDVVTTMDDIASSSHKIRDIVSVIEGISFQTNLLALNAAVEAARAGEHGRGFAVVAGEVRNLAERAREAAQEIKTLISASQQRVESGSQVVSAANESIRDILQHSQQIDHLLGEISRASTEESAGITQVGSALSTLDQSTQHNAAMAEETSAAAASLRSRAQALSEVVSMFKLPQAV
ncbi:MAG: methyl-accepting chemotaxis protein [Burkholderiales bacterium]|nr:methyl-accepting chemotaxis protein [Burkholderiales bacterium]